MKGNVEQRTIESAEYTLKHKSTVRETASIFGVGKSTTYNDLSVRLQKLNPQLYRKVRTILDQNLDERAIRGGRATRSKYMSDEVA